MIPNHMPTLELEAMFYKVFAGNDIGQEKVFCFVIFPWMRETKFRYSWQWSLKYTTYINYQHYPYQAAVTNEYTQKKHIYLYFLLS